ncbi:hypothetical protein RND71_010829 [Anisodus tanguticus]|uniref:VQ domain-containing protein n=1 Tax=Anisodus tanguticus TaxID=243964 RepID=A0AAE1SIH4_9SOLA|nr:hypothetical protein RND71_010829 [Anisodus tanguticus]
MDSQKQNPKRREPIKVKYIDSPMMVNVKNATEFRTIVQQLTGKSPQISQEIMANVEVECSSVKAPLHHETDNYNTVDELLWKELSQGISIYHYL